MLKAWLACMRLERNARKREWRGEAGEAGCPECGAYAVVVIIMGASGSDLLILPRSKLCTSFCPGSLFFPFSAVRCCAAVCRCIPVDAVRCIAVAYGGISK